jgi:DNA-binding NarL/FixJ family response regulator
VTPVPRAAWDHPDRHDHILLVADGDPSHSTCLSAHLARIPGRRSHDDGGSHPRFKVVLASTGVEAIRRAGAQVTAAAVDLLLPRRDGIEVVQELRRSRPDLAVLVFTDRAPPSQAVAALMAGADFFHECRDGDLSAFERALELAIDRRRLARFIERNEADVETARGKLAQLSGDLARALPGFRPPQAPSDVQPFREAARRYLQAATRLCDGDPKDLARRLGMSYFALRRLLARYEVRFPSRSRKHGTADR